VTRIYNNKLVLLLNCILIQGVLSAATQWVGVSSQSPAASHITTSGNTTNSTEISVEIPGFYLNSTLFEGKKYKLPQIPDGHPILTKGSPDLQKLTFTLQLPVNGNMEVSIASSKYTEYTDIDIIPSAGDEIRNGNIEKLIKGQSYSIDAFFPGDLVGSQQPFIARNTRAQSFQVYPLQYNPVTRVLRFYYQITIKAVNSQDAGVNPLDDNDYRTKPIEGIKVDYINHPSSLLKSGQLPSERGSMLIICPESYLKAIEPLAEWRRQTGISTEIVGAEQFANSDAIYAFVKNYYKNNSTLAYLLLVGDAEQVPSYMLPYGASDNYYSYLAGNDHYPDILVGRFSAESVKDVEVQAKRTIQYEKDPTADASWLTSATGIASTMTAGDDGESDFQHVRNLIKTLKTTSYNQSNEFYDGSQGEGDADGNPSTGDIITKINQGTGIILYTGHGSPLSMATGSINKSAVESLNNVGKYPLIWAAACENGNFVNKNCIAESWLRATNSEGQPTGALAALMASGSQTSYPPMQAQDKIAELMSNSEEGLSTMGAISVKGMMSMNDVYGNAGYATTDTWILFGDPSLRVRTTTPKQFVVEHPGYIGSGRIAYSFKCNTSGSFACLTNHGTILGTSTVTEGMNNIYLDYPVSGDSITLTITALNYLPYITSIEVINTPGIAGMCLPINHSKLQPISSSFSWDSGDGGNPDYYLFYLGTDNPPTNLVNGQKLTATQIKTQFNFEYNTKYYWKVVSVNSFGSKQSKVMDFKTVFGPDEDFEPIFKSKLSWNESGSQNWQNDATEHFEGTHSIRSGQINNNEFSSLAYPCQVSTCDFVSFWSKTSSESGDKLQFIVDGTTIGEWSGITDWNFHIYKIDAGLHQLEWRYTKNASGATGKDAAWLDNIHLPVHAQASANVAETGSVCGNSIFETSATAANYFTITWQTEGDGSFDDANLENAVYKPGAGDAENKQATLHMHLSGYTGCSDVDKEIHLQVNPLPVITLPSDTIVSNGGSIELDASLDGNMTYSWQPDGSSSPSIIIDSLSTINGIKTASVTVTSSEGCTATKDIRIHFNNPAVNDTYNIFPNPSNGNFTLEPVKGSAVIDQMRLVDRSGRVVWQSGGSLDIIGSQQISIEGLTGGAYFLVAENKNGKSVNNIVIK
jgi:hypothetical protein